MNERLPSEATSLNARIALNSAQKISELGADLLALDWDPAQIGCFVGYCMYVSASIHITLLCSKDITLAALARSNLVSNLKLLKSMKSYWIALERLVSDVFVSPLLSAELILEVDSNPNAVQSSDVQTSCLSW